MGGHTSRLPQVTSCNRVPSTFKFSHLVRCASVHEPYFRPESASIRTTMSAESIFTLVSSAAIVLESRTNDQLGSETTDACRTSGWFQRSNFLPRHLYLSRLGDFSWP